MLFGFADLGKYVALELNISFLSNRRISQLFLKTLLPISKTFRISQFLFALGIGSMVVAREKRCRKIIFRTCPDRDSV